MRTRGSLSALIEGRPSSPDGRSERVRLATRPILEEALEAGTRDALGRDRHERGAEEGRGHRNGHRTGRLKTAEGAIVFGTPQIAGRDEPFRSGIRGHAGGRTEALEALAVEMPARGLSVPRRRGRLVRRRRAAALVAHGGLRAGRAVLEGPTRDFATRGLGRARGRPPLRLWHRPARIRPGRRREPVMAARGFTARGRRVLPHRMAGSKEGEARARHRFERRAERDRRRVRPGHARPRARGPAAGRLRRRTGRHRGDRDPGSGSGAGSASRARPAGAASRQRMRNLAAKGPENVRPEVKARIRAARSGRRAAPSRATSPGAWPRTSRGSRPRPWPASGTTPDQVRGRPSRRASRTCGRPSPTAARSGPRTCSSAGSSRSVAG